MRLPPGPVRLDGRPGDGVDDWVDVVALPQSVERREGDTACKCIFDGRIQHVYEYADLRPLRDVGKRLIPSTCHVC